MPNKLIAIAGGSGSGKSTLAVSLCTQHPRDFALVHIDDYFKKSGQVPVLDGFVNFDHPDAIRFNDLRRDLAVLIDQQPIKVWTKSELYNPRYRSELKNKIEQVIQPKRFILLEGYLALYDARIRELADLKIYLDIPIQASVQRRSTNKFKLSALYFTEVLDPMHREFVEPTREFADAVIDVSDKTTADVLRIVENMIAEI